jgi:glycosyltransferase involved in cell wall biosynthesis
MTTPAPEVSVVVPSWNSSATIGRCLAALLAQATTRPYEIIVADSSDDDTPARVAAFAPRVQLVRSGRRLPPGPARNLGLARARGAILAFTDADCIVAPDWIEQLAAAHARAGPAAAIGGRIMNGTPDDAAGTALWLTEFVEFAGGRERRVASMPSCNISYARALFLAHGGFPDLPWGEEYVFNHRLAGGVLWTPHAVVSHVNRTELDATLRHAEQVGHGCALSRHATGQVGYLFRWPVLIPLLWGWRYAKILAAAARAGMLGKALRVTPLLARHLAAWTRGFGRGVRAAGGPA